MNCRIMSNPMSPVIIIPARMAASRLPGKPLADLAGKPMIQHVWERAVVADLAPVWVATDHEDIAAVIRDAGGHAVMTRADHPSGSDRVFEAAETIDPDHRHDAILNLQGDLPELDPAVPHALLAAMAHKDAALATLVTPASDAEVARDQVVKAVVTWAPQPDPSASRIGTAHYFSRAAVPTGPAAKYHHIGVYGWWRSALTAFVALPPSPLELSERLEQLRAIEAGMVIAVAEIDHAPGGIDTQDDLAAARLRLSGT
jgi:3-deoxy-manno-octulosonate cytidylyltransferase (CMP-KDO synthetase)